MRFINWLRSLIACPGCPKCKACTKCHHEWAPWEEYCTGFQFRSCKLCKRQMIAKIEHQQKEPNDTAE